MTTKPREFWISMCTFNDGYTEIYETRTAEFEPCPPAEKIHVIEAAPLLAKIARLEAALQKCKEQRDEVHLQFWDDVCPDWVFEQDNAELDAILEPEQERVK